MAPRQVAAPSTPRKGTLGRQPMVRDVLALTSRSAAGANPNSPGDAAFQRVQKTPRVFQSSKDMSGSRQRRELRASLLPSIVWAPTGDTAASSNHDKSSLSDREAQAEAQVVEGEVLGEFHRVYVEQLRARELVESEEAKFMRRDATFPSAEWDPQQLVANSCGPLRALVEEKQRRFRRPTESFVNTTSDLPFTHGGQSQDLAEIADILTLDIERRESIIRGTAKSPGYLSLQIASRTPLVVRDPTVDADGAGGAGGAKVASERVAGGDVHALRVDLKEGEVRQIAFGLTSKAFRETPLAQRMGAIVAPERGTVADIVRTMRAKQADMGSLVSVLNDILRDLSGELPPAPEPSSEEMRDESAKKGRLESLLSKPRSSLQRLLEVVDHIADVTSPLIPQLAHALDFIALLCVREVDRIATRSHADRELALKRVVALEDEREELFKRIEKLSGVEDNHHQKSRMARLEIELSKQERSSAALVQENERLHEELEMSNRWVGALKEKARELEEAVEALRRQRRQSQPEQARSRRNSFGRQDSSDGSPVSPSFKSRAAKFATMPVSDSLLALEQGRDGGNWLLPPGESPRRGSLRGSKESRRSSRGLAAQPGAAEQGLRRFAMPVGVQTETEHYFGEGAEAPDEVAYETYEDMMQTADRLQHLLRRYEWNHDMSRYLLRGQGPEDRSDDEAPVERRGRPKAKSKQDLAKERLVAMRKIRFKVLLAHQGAQILQQQEEISRLRELAKESFAPWAARTFEADTARPEELWTAVMGMVNGESMRVRVTDLEDALSSLRPIADRARGAVVQDSSGQSPFWRRVLGAARGPRDGRGGVGESSFVGVAEMMGKQFSMRTLSRSQLLAEVNSVWSCVQPPDESSTKKLSNVHAQVVLQNAVKAYYLRRTGSSKHVESSAVGLCRCVLEGLSEDPAVALFAVMCAVEEPTKLASALPRLRREVEYEVSEEFQLFEERCLLQLQHGAAQAMAGLILELRTLPGARPPEEEALPLPHVLSAARSHVAGRSRATARFFHLALFALAQFREPTAGGKAAAREPCVEAVFASLLLHDHVLSLQASADPGGKKGADEMVDEVWMQVATEAEPLGFIRRNLGTKQLDEALIASSRVARAIARQSVVNLPWSMVEKALLSVRAEEAGEEAGEEVMMGKATFRRLAGVWKEAPAGCRESHVLWAALWAFAHERAYELDLMGKLYDLFDFSGDGALQLDEFTELICCISPFATKADAEEFFVGGADDTAADMTKGNFIGLVLRLGISSEVDMLENLVQSKREASYGDGQHGRKASMM